MILGIPVISRPDLLAACLRSIDIDCLLVVIDNSGGPMGDVAAELRPDAVIVEPAANLGWTASVNHIIRSYPRAPEWYVSNADTCFAPGDLQRLADEAGDWVGIVDWRAFKLTARAVEAVGFWDENYFVYVSDADYERRMSLAGLDWHFISGESTHASSVTIQEERYGAYNRRSYPEEVAYHRAKWGTGVRVPGGFTTPFGRGGHLGEWRADLSILRATSWN